MALSYTRGGSDCILGKNTSQKGWSRVEQTAWGGKRVTIPRSFQETCTYGTGGHGLVGMVMGWGWTR